MKKLLSIVLAVLMLVMGTVAFAEDDSKWAEGAYGQEAYLKWYGEAPTIQVEIDWHDMVYIYNPDDGNISKETDGESLVYVTNKGVAVDLTFDAEVASDLTEIIEVADIQLDELDSSLGSVTDNTASLNAPFEGTNDEGDSEMVYPAINFTVNFRVKEGQTLTAGDFTFTNGASELRTLATITVTIAEAQ